MAIRSTKNKKMTSIPGIIIESKSGHFVAFYEHRTDIIANGANEREVRKNLKEMYESVNKYEEEENEKKTVVVLPKKFTTRPFKEKILAS